MKTVLKTLSTAAVAAGISLSVIAPASAEGEVNIYSYRKEVLVKPLLDEFTKQSGIKVNLVSGKADALLQRLKSEGMNSPADVLLTTDAGRLILAQEAGVLQATKSEKLTNLIPTQYRDPEGFWYGLSMRSRVIYYSKDRVNATELSDYEDLTNEKWKGRICIRSSGNIYNQSLLSSLVAHMGEKRAEKWAAGIVANLARKPQGGDRDQIKAVAAGECDIAVGNSYYFGRMLTSKKDKELSAALKVSLFWPNQHNRGAHVNVSGAGLTKSAKNKENALKLIEFLASDAAQKIYADQVFEYPIRNNIAPSAVVEKWGPFKADRLPLATFAQHQQTSIKIFDRVGWR
ncbi:MAG: Fe(3+) ABC transporter substrate-binding protein [Rhodospirillales bacterium]|nr:Fe(3+) ABC transporter substrate-binding protein [Rhodospirillales bacterium]